MHIQWRTLFLGLIGMALLGTPASAQKYVNQRYSPEVFGVGLGRPVVDATVTNRPRPNYDPVGARMGSYWLYPYASVGVLYDDNVFATNFLPQEDTTLVSNAALLMESDWGRHMLDFEFSVQNYTHDKFSSEDHTDLQGRSQFRIDVRRDFNIAGQLYAAQLHEERGSADAPTLAAEPVPYQVYEGSLSLNKRFNRFSVQVGGAVQRLDYDNVPAIGGGVVIEDFRDGNVYTALTRLGYEFSPGYRAFVDVGGNNREFGEDLTGTNRDSDGWDVRGGVEFEVTHLMAGEISAGYLEQNYKSPDLKDVNAPAVRGVLIWNPSQLMTVNFYVDTRVSETTSFLASSHLDTAIGARIDYELRRNIIVSPYLSYINEDYQGIPRDDNTLYAGLEAEYLIGRNWSAKAYYRYTTKDSNVDFIDYNRNQVGASVKIQF